MTSSRPTDDLDQFIIAYDKDYGPGAFAKQMEASIGVPEHLKQSNAGSLLLTKQIMLQEQDFKPQRQSGQMFKTEKELEQERVAQKQIEQARVRGLSTSYEDARDRVLRQQHLERLANEEKRLANEQQQQRMLVKAASKGSLGGKRTHRRKRKVARKRYSRRLKSRSSQRGRHDGRRV
jgi:pyruvate-formate lyase